MQMLQHKLKTHLALAREGLKAECSMDARPSLRALGRKHVKLACGKSSGPRDPEISLSLNDTSSTHLLVADKTESALETDLLSAQQVANRIAGK